jgi:pimeloyl-ACP methyl ester carboxylesterase
MRVDGKVTKAVDSTRLAGVAVLFVMLAVGLGLGIVAWRNPLWLVDQQVDARLRLNGVHSEFVTVNGYKMHYLVGGSGRPLVLIHGLGSRAADWANLIPQLIDGGHRIYAVDLLGYGQSAQPRDAAYSISQQAAMVEGFLNSQHLQQVDLAGWSMGGWIAMRIALHQPERIRRLVLLDSAGLRFKLGFDPSIFQPASPTDIAALEELLVPHPRPLPRFLAVAMLRKGDRVGWVVRRSVQSMMTGEDLVDGKLGALTMPVLIGWGDQDRLIPLSVGYQLHREILQSVLDVYAGCGHLAPGQCVSQVGPSVVDFLNAQPARMAMVRQIPSTDTVATGQ